MEGFASPKPKRYALAIRRARKRHGSAFEKVGTRISFWKWWATISVNSCSPFQTPIAHWLRVWQEYRPKKNFETNIVVKKAAAKGDSNSVFRNILLQLHRHQAKWQQFQRQIGRIFPGYTLHVDFDPDTYETIDCTVARAGGVFPIDTCGTGVLQGIQIFSYINLFSPKILLLDEPDSHLHPNNQKQLARELIGVAESGMSIVVSTHSKHLVEALLDHARLIWLRDGRKQEDVQDYELKALLEIGALNVGERLGNPTDIVLTEDKNQDLMEILLEANGFDLDACDVVAYAGCTQIGTAVALICHLRKTHPNAEFVLHRDRDFLDEESVNEFAQKFASMDLDVFFPERNDLEAYFASVEHVASSCNIAADIAQDVVETAYQARRPALIEKYVNTRIENAKRAGLQVNAGAIAAECTAAMTGPGTAVVHGKILLKGIRQELKTRGIADNLLSSSPALDIQALRDLSN
jgi:hypothetical protein